MPIFRKPQRQYTIRWTPPWFHRGDEREYALLAGMAAVLHEIVDEKKLCEVVGIAADENGYALTVELPRRGDTDTQLDAIETALLGALDAKPVAAKAANGSVERAAVGDEQTGRA